jgi:hypothetical protein
LLGWKMRKLGWILVSLKNAVTARRSRLDNLQIDEMRGAIDGSHETVALSITVSHFILV